MIEDECVRPERCISEPCLDISTNGRDMRSGFGYILLLVIRLGFEKRLMTSIQIRHY